MMFLIFSILLVMANCGTTLESLSQSKACRQDYEAIKDSCNVPQAQSSGGDDVWWVFACLQSPPDNIQISKSCDSLLWEFKLNMTSQDSFLAKAGKFCTDEVNELRICERDKESPAHFVSCLVQNKHSTKNPGCRIFLERIEALIFSDFRLIGNFTNACKSDIIKLQCGRTGVAKNEPHSQGRTISCLEEKIEELEPKCKSEIFQLAELQGENVNYDKTLFQSCKDEINRLCSAVSAGTHGQVYDCLMNNKVNGGMSQKCIDHVSRRQKLTSLDYKVSMSLATKCKADIEENKCSDQNVGPDEVTKLSHIIVCLEDALFNGKQVAGECVSAMDEHRRQLLQDLSISPEVVKNCQSDLNRYCSSGGHKLHCLMNVTISKEVSLEQPCQRTLEDFIRETEENLDWRADPALEDACAEVVFSSCDPKSSKEGILNCLMDNLASESESMTGDCRAVLMQIHYFLAREVIVDKKLYHECKKDARHLCEAGKNWHKSSNRPDDKLVFPCLVRNMYLTDLDDDNQYDEDVGHRGGESEKDGDDDDSVLSKGCVEQIERVLKQRARSVLLKPELEKACRGFLHMQCTSYVKIGEEMKCLKDNYDILPDECKMQVAEDIQIEISEYYLHPNLIKGCEPELTSHCVGFHGKKDAQGAVNCLFRTAMDYPFGSVDGISKKCAAVLEGIQVLEMKDFKFSRDLRKACKPSVKKYCPDKRTTYDVMSCLVQTIIDDIVNDQDAKISKQCITQLDFELQLKHSNPKLDPILTTACQDELSTMCEGMSGLEAVECLRNLHHSKLSRECKKVLLQEQEEEAINNQVDVHLVRNCKKEIKQHCSTANTTSIISCLAEFVQELDFDQKCAKVLKNRISQHSFDIRLNTDLTRSCRRDINSYCHHVMEQDNEFHEGKVIFCLKEIYTKNVNLLSKACARQLILEIKEENVAAVDPRLQEVCPELIKTCKSLVNQHKPEGFESCLYSHLVKGDVVDGNQCINVLAVHAQSQNRDVHADQFLYRACSLDLNKFCRDVLPGDGRKFSCLVTISKDPNFALEPRCDQILKNRVAMFYESLKVHPMNQAMELYKSVMESENRNEFLSAVFFFVAIIFIIGLCFGRVTKRVNREIKNK